MIEDCSPCWVNETFPDDIQEILLDDLYDHSHKKYIVRKLGPFYCSATIEVEHTKTAVATVHEVL